MLVDMSKGMWAAKLGSSKSCSSQLELFIPTLLLLLHLFFSRTSWVSRYQKGKTSLDLSQAWDDGDFGMQWHQLDHMQTICTSLQADDHTNTSSLNFYTYNAYKTFNNLWEIDTSSTQKLTTTTAVFTPNIHVYQPVVAVIQLLLLLLLLIFV